MAISAHKHIDQTSLELKQTSFRRMLLQAKALHQQGHLHKVIAPLSRVRSKPEPLRVQPAVA